jgi:hypothetical protein
MINLTHIISILNFIFTVMIYAVKWLKLDLTYICLEEFLNQLNLLYVYIWNRIRFMGHTIKWAYMMYMSYNIGDD